MSDRSHEQSRIRSFVGQRKGFPCAGQRDGFIGWHRRLGTKEQNDAKKIGAGCRGIAGSQGGLELLFFCFKPTLGEHRRWSQNGHNN
jgi:hypothetical protein